MVAKQQNPLSNITGDGRGNAGSCKAEGQIASGGPSTERGPHKFLQASELHDIRSKAIINTQKSSIVNSLYSKRTPPIYDHVEAPGQHTLDVRRTTYTANPYVATDEPSAGRFRKPQFIVDATPGTRARVDSDASLTAQSYTFNKANKTSAAPRDANDLIAVSNYSQLCKQDYVNNLRESIERVTNELEVADHSGIKQSLINFNRVAIAEGGPEAEQTRRSSVATRNQGAELLVLDSTAKTRLVSHGSIVSQNLNAIQNKVSGFMRYVPGPQGEALHTFAPSRIFEQDDDTRIAVTLSPTGVEVGLTLGSTAD